MKRRKKRRYEKDVFRRRRTRIQRNKREKDRLRKRILEEVGPWPWRSG